MRVRLLALFSLMIGCQDKFVERKLNWDAELSASRQEAPQLRAYPKTPAALKAMTADTRWRQAS